MRRKVAKLAFFFLAGYFLKKKVAEKNGYFFGYFSGRGTIVKFHAHRSEY
jgi:hypothetical protein